MSTDIIAQLILALATLLVAAIVFVWALAMVAARRPPQRPRAAVPTRSPSGLPGSTAAPATESRIIRGKVEK